LRTTPPGVCSAALSHLTRQERGSTMDRLIGLADLAVMLTLVAVVVLIAIL
jgi:hypothetical protein